MTRADILAEEFKPLAHTVVQADEMTLPDCENSLRACAQKNDAQSLQGGTMIAVAD